MATYDARSLRAGAVSWSGEWEIAKNQSFQGTKADYIQMRVFLDAALCDAVTRRLNTWQATTEQAIRRDKNLWPDEDEFRSYFNYCLRKERDYFWILLQKGSLNRFKTIFRGAVNIMILLYFSEDIPTSSWITKCEQHFSYLAQDWHFNERKEILSEYVSLYQEAKSGFSSPDLKALQNQKKVFESALFLLEKPLYALADAEGKIKEERSNLRPSSRVAKPEDSAVIPGESISARKSAVPGESVSANKSTVPGEFVSVNKGAISSERVFANKGAVPGRGLPAENASPRSEINRGASDEKLPNDVENNAEQADPEYEIAPWPETCSSLSGGTWFFRAPPSGIYYASMWEKLRFLWYLECSAAVVAPKIRKVSGRMARERERDNVLRALWGKFYPGIIYNASWIDRVLYPGRDGVRISSGFHNYCRAIGVALQAQLDKVDITQKIHMNTLLLGRAVFMAIANMNPQKALDANPRSLLPNVMAYLDSVAYVPRQSDKRDKETILELLSLYAVDENPDNSLEPEALRVIQPYRDIIHDNYKAVRDSFNRQNEGMQQKLNEANKLAEGAEVNLKKQLVKLMDLGSNGHCLGELYRFMKKTDDYEPERIRSHLFVLFSALSRLDISPVGAESLNQRLVPGSALFEKSVPDYHLGSARNNRFLRYPGWSVNGMTVVPPIYTVKDSDSETEAAPERGDE